MKVNFKVKTYAVVIDTESVFKIISTPSEKERRFAELIQSLEGFYGVNPTDFTHNFLFESKKHADEAAKRFTEIGFNPIVPNMPTYFDRRYLKKPGGRNDKQRND